MSEPPVITTQAAAEIIGCTDANVRLLLIRGKIAGTKWGRDWRVDESSARRYAAIQQKTGRPRSVQNS